VFYDIDVAVASMNIGLLAASIHGTSNGFGLYSARGRNREIDRYPATARGRIQVCADTILQAKENVAITGLKLSYGTIHSLSQTSA
jgi:hypothetical protein